MEQTIDRTQIGAIHCLESLLDRAFRRLFRLSVTQRRLFQSRMLFIQLSQPPLNIQSNLLPGFRPPLSRQL